MNFNFFIKPDQFKISKVCFSRIVNGLRKFKYFERSRVLDERLSHAVFELVGFCIALA